ncbi:helix-turn-helix domain-containing protein [Streptomyces caniferus]
MNTALKDAMERAGVRPHQLALKVGVDHKTVSRWLTYPERAPREGTRADVGQALGVDPVTLWPKSVQSRVKTGHDREIVAAYPFRSAAPTSLWASLIDGSSQNLTFAGYTNYFLWQQHPRLGARLATKANHGARVRFLVGDPESEVTRKREEVEGVPLTVSTRIKITLDALAKMGPCDGVEARFSDQHIALSVFMFDDQMLVTPHIASLLGDESPMLHLRRLEDDGLYDRFASHVTALWEGGRQAEL